MAICQSPGLAGGVLVDSNGKHAGRFAEAASSAATAAKRHERLCVLDGSQRFPCHGRVDFEERRPSGNAEICRARHLLAGIFPRSPGEHVWRVSGGLKREMTLSTRIGARSAGKVELRATLPVGRLIRSYVFRRGPPLIASFRRTSGAGPVRLSFRCVPVN